MSRLYTKSVMVCSALLMLTMGLLFTFAPDEVIYAATGLHLPLLTVAAQACGALYLGFAILNWMAKDTLIGGIYSRPVAMGNFTHFFVVLLALTKLLWNAPRSGLALGLALFYLIFAFGFGSVLFRHPALNRAIPSSSSDPQLQNNGAVAAPTNESAHP